MLIKKLFTIYKFHHLLRIVNFKIVYLTIFTYDFICEYNWGMIGGCAITMHVVPLSRDKEKGWIKTAFFSHRKN